MSVNATDLFTQSPQSRMDKFGFLAIDDEIEKCSDSQFALLVKLATEIPLLLQNKQVKGHLEEKLKNFKLGNWSQAIKRRANAMLAFLCHAYVIESGGDCSKNSSAVELPSWLAQLFYESATSIKRFPTQTYETYVLENWRLLDPTKELDYNNIKPITTYTNTLAEEWFIKVHVVSEYLAAKALTQADLINDLLQSENIVNLDAGIINHLAAMEEGISELTENIKRMYDYCPTSDYYHTVRPHISNWAHGVVYQGVDTYKNEVMKFRGASGAQSSIIPALDNFLNLQVKQSHTMQDMLNYMPFEHVEQIKNFNRGGLKEYVNSSPSIQLKESFNTVVEAVAKFRRVHYDFIVKEYVVKFIFDKHAGEVYQKFNSTHPDNNLSKEMLEELLHGFFYTLKNIFNKYNTNALLDEANTPILNELMQILYGEFKLMLSQVLGTGKTDFSAFLPNNITQTLASQL